MKDHIILQPKQSQEKMAYQNPVQVKAFKAKLLEHLSLKKSDPSEAELQSLDIILYAVDEFFSIVMETNQLVTTKTAYLTNKLRLADERKTCLELYLNELRSLDKEMMEDSDQTLFYRLREHAKNIKEMDMVTQRLFNLEEEIGLITINLSLKYGEINEKGTYHSTHISVSDAVARLQQIFKTNNFIPFQTPKELTKVIEEEPVVKALFGDD